MTTTTAYRTLFQDYLDAGLQLVLAQVQAAEPLVPDELRRQAWHLLSYAFESDAAWPLTRDLLLALAPKMEQAGFRDEWIAYLEQGVRLSQLLGDGLTTAECQLHIGHFYRLLNRFDLSRQWLVASANNFSQLGDRRGQARVHNQLAYMNYMQRRYDEATLHAQAALRLLNGTDVEQAMNYRVLGLIATELGKATEAESYHQQALAIFERAEDQRHLAWSLQNLGYTLRSQGQFEQAIHSCQRAATILHDLGDIHNWAIVQMTLGQIYLDEGRPLQACNCLNAAEEIFLRLHDQAYLARLTTNQGIAYLALEQWRQAEDAFCASIRFHQAIGDDAWRLNAVDGLAMVYLAQNKYEASAELLRQAQMELPHIANAPNYDYLVQAIAMHLQQAERQQRQEATDQAVRQPGQA